MTLIEFEKNGNIKFAEPLIIALLGFDDSEILNYTIKDILHNEDVDKLEEQISREIYFENIFSFIKKDKEPVRINGVFVKKINDDPQNYILQFKVRQEVFRSETSEKDADLQQNGEYSLFHSRFVRLQAENTERLKELAAINQTTGILKEGKGIEESLQKIVTILPKAWQYPEYTVARIIFANKEYKSQDFKVTPWCQSQRFETIDGNVGVIEIYYLNEFPAIDEGPFLREERHLINNLSVLITGYLNSSKAKSFIKKVSENDSKPEESKSPGHQLLQEFLNKHNSDRDIYHDLMPFKVKEILLIATLYDAYSIEKEGRFTEHILGEYHQLNLTSLPRITGVSSPEEAFEQLNNKHFDLVIMMTSLDKKTPVELCRKIKESVPYIPVFLLLNNNHEIEEFEKLTNTEHLFDKMFVWNGDSKVFFAMVKLIEDKINVENDTSKGMVRVILLVEDSAKFYSRYLPMLYHIVLGQTKQLIEEVSSDELYKVLKLRARPKILLASSYEEAVDIFNNYKDYMLCLISDMKFYKGGNLDERAGIALVKYIRNYIQDLPIVIQSSEEENSKLAFQIKTSFIYKNSDTLLQDFKSFITYYLGFGNFIYRDAFGRQIAVARSMQEFVHYLKTIPDESVLYHATKNHFSLWLMARGEIQIAKIIHPVKVSDFESPGKMRNYIISVINSNLLDKSKGKIVPFDDSVFEDESNIASLASGALGGKGRGVSFINTLIQSFDLSKLVPNINIKSPRTFIVGTDEYEYFLEKNNLFDIIYNEKDYEVIKRAFVNSRLSDGLVKRIKRILKNITKPIAVRSSGLFEDSLMQPFAGIFETYLLPNNHPDFEKRVEQTLNAIKLVYASVFSSLSRGYIEAINYKIEEEKMAVVIQEVVGNSYDGYFYPHISGVAQSYNYYPYAHMKPEEGFAVSAFGLGKYVVEGENAYRYSPRYPDVEINSPKDQYKNSQTEFYAVDLNKYEFDLLEGDTAGLAKISISDAEKHGTLKHCVSIYDISNETLEAGLDKHGPRVVNFANILKYNYMPLAKTIEVMLDVVKEAFGSPVEIEFAVDLNKDSKNKASFYLLQIKPLIGNAVDFNVDMSEIDKESIFMYAERGMGNGIVKELHDVVFVDVAAFDKTDTVQMTNEIEEINARIGKEGKKYVLIGPGRWGTRDRFIGIPVTWPQISNAKVIVEHSMEDFPLDASLGSHFFHNVTAMNVGYFSVQPENSNSFINWEILKNQEVVFRTKYFIHVRFNEQVIVRMDGKKRISVITVG